MVNKADIIMANWCVGPVVLCQKRCGLSNDWTNATVLYWQVSTTLLVLACWMPSYDGKLEKTSGTIKTCLLLAWSCMKQKKQLRIDFLEDTGEAWRNSPIVVQAYIRTDTHSSNHWTDFHASYLRWHIFSNKSFLVSTVRNITWGICPKNLSKMDVDVQSLAKKTNLKLQFTETGKSNQPKIRRPNSD